MACIHTWGELKKFKERDALEILIIEADGKCPSYTWFICTTFQNDGFWSFFSKSKVTCWYIFRSVVQIFMIFEGVLFLSTFVTISWQIWYSKSILAPSRIILFVGVYRSISYSLEKNFCIAWVFDVYIGKCVWVFLNEGLYSA